MITESVQIVALCSWENPPSQMAKEMDEVLVWEGSRSIKFVLHWPPDVLVPRYDTIVIECVKRGPHNT